MVKEGYKHVSLNMPDHIVDRIDELAQLNRRDRSAEIIVACEEHIEADYRLTTNRFIRMIPDENKRQMIKELLEEEYASKCPRCRQPIDVDSRFCKICGKPLTAEAAKEMKILLDDVDNALLTDPHIVEELTDQMIEERTTKRKT